MLGLRAAALLLLVATAPPAAARGRCTTKVHEVTPHLTHWRPGMVINVTGTDFISYGDVRCNLGGDIWVPGTVGASTWLTCVAPNTKQLLDVQAGGGADGGVVRPSPSSPPSPPPSQPPP